MNSPMYKLVKVKPVKPRRLSCRFWITSRSETDNIDVLIVSISGISPDGSRGRDQARFMAIKAMEGMIAFDPDAIIFDFSDLHYRWGNSILGIFQNISIFKDSENEEFEPPFPQIIVVGPASRDGILSLLGISDEKESNTVFNNLNDAIAQAAKAGKAWLDY